MKYTTCPSCKGTTLKNIKSERKQHHIECVCGHKFTVTGGIVVRTLVGQMTMKM